MNKFSFKIHIHKNGKLFGWGVSPSADWRILFTVFTILIISVFTLGVYVFIGITNGNIFLVDQSTTTVSKKIDTELIKKTVSYYDARAKNLQKIKSSSTEVNDPSF